MIDLLTVEKEFISQHIRKGGVAADFTMGNGHDTLWLSRQVGEEGRVYAFDIQPAALEHTRALLEANAGEYIKERLCAGMFNLGYLPGSDKKITTLRESTMKAVVTALDLLEDGGGLLVAVYPGHEEGTLEGLMLDDYFASLDRKKISVSKLKIVNSPSSPFFFLAEKK
ncbi:MAG: hypothetical protein BHW37_05105 [Firmicutes bacterium CAG:272_52_7]|nr:MAG: hypothetical protein BHW37_05105 [Firmicutes bacterium CAG:272_52_7]